jgi:hypothetical protein
MTGVESSGRAPLLALIAIVALGGARVAIEPRELARPDTRLDASAREDLQVALEASRVPRSDAARALAARRVVLVGDATGMAEPIAFVTQLVQDLRAQDGRGAVLVLELPRSAQPHLECYLATGEEGALDEAWRTPALPYRGLVRWARAHPELVRTVIAAGEDPSRVLAMRVLGWDTRSASLAAEIERALVAWPEARVVAFGRRMHMMVAGRYGYDSDSRRPVGERLLRAGMRRDELAAIWLVAGGPLADGVRTAPGTIGVEGPAGALPIALFDPEPVAGARALRDVVDQAVYLGTATPLAR